MQLMYVDLDDALLPCYSEVAGRTAVPLLYKSSITVQKSQHGDVCFRLRLADGGGINLPMERRDQTAEHEHLHFKVHLRASRSTSHLRAR